MCYLYLIEIKKRLLLNYSRNQLMKYTKFQQSKAYQPTPLTLIDVNQAALKKKLIKNKNEKSKKFCFQLKRKQKKNGPPSSHHKPQAKQTAYEPRQYYNTTYGHNQKSNISLNYCKNLLARREASKPPRIQRVCVCVCNFQKNMCRSKNSIDDLALLTSYAQSFFDLFELCGSFKAQHLCALSEAQKMSKCACVCLTKWLNMNVQQTTYI